MKVKESNHELTSIYEGIREDIIGNQEPQKKEQKLILLTDINQPGKERNTFNITQFKKRIEKKIIGQPDLIDRLVNLEMKNSLFFGRREVPQVFLLMGLNGTGKKGVAKSYINTV